jgi:hypothetical protein
LNLRIYIYIVEIKMVIKDQFVPTPSPSTPIVELFSGVIADDLYNSVRTGAWAETVMAKHEKNTESEKNRVDIY